MDKSRQYCELLSGLVHRFADTQMKALGEAAHAVALSMTQGGTLYVFGTGHSHMIAEEFFYRAGGLARVYPILDEGLMLHNGAHKSTDMERLPGYAEAVLSRYDTQAADVLLIASNSGRNAVPVEMAMLAKEKKMMVIGLTNLEHSRQVEARHSSGKKLYELCDIVIDNCGVFGDAAIQIDGIGRMGSTSSVIGCMAAQLLGMMTAQEMLNLGAQPEIYSSANTDEGEARNREILRKYEGIIKPL